MVAAVTAETTMTARRCIIMTIRLTAAYTMGRSVFRASIIFSRKYYVLPQGKVVETAIGCFAGDMKEGEWRFSKKSRDVKSVLTVEYAAGLRSGCYSYRSVCSSRAFVSGGSDILLRMRVENNHPVDAVECDYRLPRHIELDGDIVKRLIPLDVVLAVFFLLFLGFLPVFVNSGPEIP